MARQALTEPATGIGPAEMAGVLAAVHAQVMSAGELAIARRIAGATVRDVQAAVWDEHALAKTFGPRGTVHLVPTADLPMWAGAFSALSSKVPAHPDPVRFSPDQAEEVLAAIASALEDAELTVDELTEAIRRRAGPWAVERTMDAFQDKWPRWRQLTSVAGHRGILCFGHSRGRNVTYTSPRRWLPDFQPMDGPAAARSLLLRYLHAYGPASPEHFARWLGIPPRSATELFERNRRHLAEVRLGSLACWTAADDLELPQSPARGVRLLPYFDGYAVAGQPRTRVFPGRAAERALTPTGGAGNYPVLLVDGIVGGVWHQRRAGSSTQVTVEPLRPLTAAQRRELNDEVALVAAAIGARPTLTIGRVTVGAHA